MKNLGFPCEKENVFTSGMAAGMFLRDNKKGKKVYVCGTESLKNELFKYVNKNVLYEDLSQEEKNMFLLEA